MKRTIISYLCRRRWYTSRIPQNDTVYRNGGNRNRGPWVLLISPNQSIAEEYLLSAFDSTSNPLGTTPNVPHDVLAAHASLLRQVRAGRTTLVFVAVMGDSSMSTGWRLTSTGVGTGYLCSAWNGRKKHRSGTMTHELYAKQSSKSVALFQLAVR
jgi:hypothetical protein